MFVIKRNNSLVDFDLNKIKVAISKAMKECDKYDKADLDKVVEKIDNEISDWNKEYNEDLIHIEDIQNIIENQLMKNGLTEVAKAYILYRDNRRKIRDEQAHLYKESQDRIKEIIEMKNIENANANVDEGSFSGKNAKITQKLKKRKCFFELSPFFVLFYKTFLIQAKKLADSMKAFAAVVKVSCKIGRAHV